MLSYARAHAFALVSILSLARAAVTPTSPDGSTVVKVGSPINALWGKDMTGNWTDLQIQLMTGDNFNMVPLATVASGLDGTTLTSFAFNAPSVSPNSKIYFLQLTKGGDVTTATWTTRFTIAAADGTVTDPTNTTTYSGVPVQWGTGILLANSTAATNGTSTSGSSVSSALVASSTAVSAISSSTLPSAMSSTLSYASTTTTAVAAVVPSSSSSSSSSSASRSASGTITAAAAAATSSKSAAGRLEVAGLSAVLAGVLGAMML